MKTASKQVKTLFSKQHSGYPLFPANSIKDLEVWLDVWFSFGTHVKINGSCFNQMHDLRYIWKCFMCEAAILACNTFMDSHLDPFNSLFTCLSKSYMKKVQNSLAKIIRNGNKFSRITLVLKLNQELNWLPVEQHSIFKTLTLVYL